MKVVLVFSFGYERGLFLSLHRFILYLFLLLLSPLPPFSVFFAS